MDESFCIKLTYRFSGVLKTIVVDLGNVSDVHEDLNIVYRGSLSKLSDRLRTDPNFKKLKQKIFK